MKKFALILISALLLCSCSSYRDIKILDVQLEKISVNASPFIMDVAVEIDNPSIGLDLTDISATIHFEDRQVLMVQCEDFKLKGHSRQVYHLELKASLAPGFNLFSALQILQSSKLEDAQLDVRASARDFLGIKHTKEVKNLDLCKSLESI